MTHRTTAYLLITTAILFFHCNKKNEPLVTIHCESLVNDVLPAKDAGAVFIANAFTPNSDGINDAFRPILKNISSESIKIYDSNSQLVFQSSQLNAYWIPTPSGKKMEKYFYRVEVVTQNNNKTCKCGEVNALSCYPSYMNKNCLYFENQFNGSGFIDVTHEGLSTCN